VARNVAARLDLGTARPTVTAFVMRSSRASSGILDVAAGGDKSLSTQM